MYEENKARFDWKGFLLKLAFAIVAVILIVKLLPVNNSANNKNNTKTDANTVFKTNMDAMKDAGINYFNQDKLPATTGDKVKISLGEMIRIGLLTDLKDHKNKACDNEKSYIQATKTKKEYELEIYLKCGSKTELSHAYLACYDFCEKSTTSTTTTTSTKTTKKPNTENHSTRTTTTKAPVVKPTTTTTTTTKMPTTTLPPRHAVIFNSAGGTPITTQYILVGESAIQPDSPVREGYNFAGWFYNGNPYDFSTPVGSNRIIIAKWIPIETPLTENNG